MNWVLTLFPCFFARCSCPFFVHAIWWRRVWHLLVLAYSCLKNAHNIFLCLTLSNDTDRCCIISPLLQYKVKQRLTFWPGDLSCAESCISSLRINLQCSLKEGHALYSNPYSYTAPLFHLCCPVQDCGQQRHHRWDIPRPQEPHIQLWFWAQISKAQKLWADR